MRRNARRLGLVVRRLVVAAAFVVGLQTSEPAVAQALDMGDWLEKSDDWREGYAHAFLQGLTKIINSAEAPHYTSTAFWNRCLGPMTEQMLVESIGRYLQHHPAAAGKLLVEVSMLTVVERCGPVPSP